ncbi:hypothetical protein OXPF_18450 [Oxobacter pfennigii]|uniref:Uncharacterized protein n=1 Tax=Oxobacter pfennigii TaxID=36849 RepID=A0A0P9AH31_9CLOT|nr:hypothetical protein [Oxobacter pfennigii]KPU44759.1 hypothetical protein OXPF_18450 [Oxobacter pfennigii]
MIRRLLQEVGKGKFLLLWGLSLLFGLSERTGQNLFLPLHVLAVLNDQYYFIFAVLPIFLFFCASVMEDDVPMVLLRYRTYGRYFYVKWRGLAVLSVLLWMGQMLAIMISGFGLSINGSWYISEGPKADIFHLLQGIFLYPVEAVFCSAGYLLLGYWVIGLTALWLGHFCQRSLAAKLLMGLYLPAVAWIKLPAMSRPPFVFFTGINHWILLLHNLTEPWRTMVTAGTTLALIIGMVWSVRWKWRWQPNLPKYRQTGLARYYRRLLFSKQNVLALATVIFLLAIWSWLRGGPPADATDWLFRLFAGHGTGYFYPMGFLFLLVIDTLPLWPLCVLSEQAAGEKTAFLTIRLTWRRELVGSILNTAFLWILFCGCLLTFAAVIPPLMQDQPVDVWLTLTAVGLKILDICLQFLLIFAALCLTGHTTIGFIAVVLMHFLCVLPVSWLPVGLSSMLRLALPQTGGIIPPWTAIGLLLGLAFGLIIWLHIQGTKLLFNH